MRHGCLDFLPSANEDEVAEIARWFTHTGVLKATQRVTLAADPRQLDQIAKEHRTSVLILRNAGQFSARVLAVADAFQLLQDARHRADYDGTYDPYRAVTMNHVNDARSAVESTWWLWRSQWSRKDWRLNEYATYRSFLRLALLDSGGPKTR